MRVTISHHKGQQEAIRLVDRASDDLFKGIATGPVQITNTKKSWSGSTMSFSFEAGMGLMKLPLSGTVLVTEKDVTVECELPGFLKNLLPEDKIKSGIETRVRGLLGP